MHQLPTHQRLMDNLSHNQLVTNGNFFWKPQSVDLFSNSLWLHVFNANFGAGQITHNRQRFFQFILCISNPTAAFFNFKRLSMRRLIRKISTPALAKFQSPVWNVKRTNVATIFTALFFIDLLSWRGV